ncbi:hypothetical protein NWP13_23650 [Rhodococcus pyridinivorans]|nr:hypothetical protein [Rhodococcus pyridinivorans]MCR8695528.1 hypothetical protein [Rhodococcus pyridinivorans]
MVRLGEGGRIGDDEESASRVVFVEAGEEVVDVHAVELGVVDDGQWIGAFGLLAESCVQDVVPCLLIAVVEPEQRYVDVGEGHRCLLSQADE